MKSGTSFFNGTIFRKDMSRFAPVRLLYTMGLLLGMFLLLDGNEEYWFAAHLGTMSSAMAAVNCGYALLVAQVLFGDLWNPRMCNALHALPMRRSCWFNTHVVSGVFFSILPTVIMVAVAEAFIITMSAMEQGWQVPLYFLLASNLQFLFFFSLAVFCAQCAGNRVGMAVTYGIANFFSYLVYFLVDNLIAPMYHGVVPQNQLFMFLCPVAQLCSSPLVESRMNRVYHNVPAGADYRIYGTFALGDGWWYLFLLAGIALVLLLVARGMYRRRKLEYAGDFLAAKKLEPLFMVVFPLTVGTVFQCLETAILGTGNRLPVMLFAGLALGWFGGRMLVERQGRVLLRLKNWLGFFLLILALAGCLYGLSLDPLGIEDWVPSGENIRSATITSSYRGMARTEDPEEIARILAIHRGALEDKLTQEQAGAEYDRALAQAGEEPLVAAGRVHTADMVQKMDYRRHTTISIQYELAGGYQVAREYLVWVDSEPAQLAKPFFNRVSAIFYHHDNIQDAEDLYAMVRVPQYMAVDGVVIPQKMLSKKMITDMVDAVLADCEAGTLTQNNAYHKGVVLDTANRVQQCYYIDVSLGNGVGESWYISVYADSENCLKWMDAYGLRELVEAQYAAETK